MTYPEILTNSDDLQVIVCACEGGLLTKKAEFILDLNQFREIIGLEIFNLKLEAGEGCLTRIKENISTMDGNIRYSYDEDSDSFYLQLADEFSADQKAVIGTLTLNTKGEIVGFCAKSGS